MQSRKVTMPQKGEPIRKQMNAAQANTTAKNPARRTMPSAVSFNLPIAAYLTRETIIGCPFAALTV